MLRAVDYLRVSTEDQRRGYGIAYTGKKTARHIENKGWAHVDTYADEGFSGTLDHTERPDLQRLMKDAHTVPRPFDVVVVPEERAIGRRDRAFWPWVWALEDLGVLVAVVRGDYDNTTEEGRSRMRKEADRAEDERITIRNRTQGGIQEKAEDGGLPGGKARYGYRIADKGQTGLSRLEIDPDESKTLRRARELVIEYKGNWRKTATALNAENFTTRAGKPWSHPNLRMRLMNEDLLEARYIFRNPKNTGKKGVRTDDDGVPIYGESIVINLDPIFTEEEVAELRRAVARRARPAPSSDKTYSLTRRLTSPCGAHYVGWSRNGEAFKYYRCAGRIEEYPGAKVCDCSMINATAVERWVWREVCALLGDAERLKALAEQWVGLAQGRAVDYAARLEGLEQQISEQEAAIDTTTAVAAVQAAKRGLKGPEAQASVERTVRPLEGELERLVAMRTEVATWQAEADQAEQRSRDLQTLAQRAHDRLDTLGEAEQAEFLALLNIKVAVTGRPGRAPKGQPCSLAGWFKSEKRAVPRLTDAGWTKVQHVARNRAALEAVLGKAADGRAWAVVGDAHRSAFKRWQKSGAWRQIMDLLAEEETVPAYEPALLPPMKFTGEISPGVILASDPEDHGPASGPSGPFSRVTYQFEITQAA